MRRMNLADHALVGKLLGLQILPVQLTSIKQHQMKSQNRVPVNTLSPVMVDCEFGPQVKPSCGTQQFIMIY